MIHSSYPDWGIYVMFDILPDRQLQRVRWAPGVDEYGRGVA